MISYSDDQKFLKISIILGKFLDGTYTDKDSIKLKEAIVYLEDYTS